MNKTRITREDIRNIKRKLRAFISAANPDECGSIFLCHEATLAMGIDYYDNIWTSNPVRVRFEQLLEEDKISLCGEFKEANHRHEYSNHCSYRLDKHKRRLAWLIKNEKRWLDAERKRVKEQK